MGGVFNPPHIGHLVCAQEAAIGLELDELLLVPAGAPPHRAVTDEPGAAVRFELCERAVAGDPVLHASRIEVDRDGPSFSVDTLRALRDERPDDDLLLILGGDAAAGLPSWHEPEELLTLAQLAIAERSGFERERVTAALEALPAADSPEFFGMPRIEVSSTLVRERVAAGKPIRYLVPDGVAELIAERSLYRAAAVVEEGA